MATFIVDGKEKVLNYLWNGIDCSADFIGNTAHGMDIDDEGRFIASKEEFEWWKATISDYEAMDKVVEKYVAEFGDEAVQRVIEEASGGRDMEDIPAHVILELTREFGEI